MKTLVYEVLCDASANERADLLVEGCAYKLAWYLRENGGKARVGLVNCIHEIPSGKRCYTCRVYTQGRTFRGDFTFASCITITSRYEECMPIDLQGGMA